MLKYLIVGLLFSLTVLSSNVLEDKVKNIIGQKEYKTHKRLIKLLFKDEKKFLSNNAIKYYDLFKELQQNGLLNLHLNRPKDITIEFKILNKSIKAYKILNDTLQALGYRYFFTKSMNLEDNKELTWKILFKAEYMLDPVVLLKELRINNCKVIEVVNKDSNHWYYEIDFSNSKLARAIKIEKNEKIKFNKPLRAFLLDVENGKKLQIKSRNLNNWFPHIVFFDNDLKVLKTIKKNRIYKGLNVKIPENTKYIKITDKFNLINIKRGLTIIVR
jgi:hypothetical protein